MLKLVDITKQYVVGENITKALKGINLEFRKNEFVSILGPSGCGKTTMLNIVGGLDKYTSGDLLIDSTSTKYYSDVDWDAYRNIRIGFVFQSYNLISHINILANVEMALTLSGIGKAERKKRAMEALESVGLADQANKKPNQLSGGQMQRVAIARALINNPDIILADEPTGALDSTTSLQIMQILERISQEKLIIMVTHNGQIAQQYSTRIISLKDGLVVDDTNPYHSNQEDLNVQNAQQGSAKNNEDSNQLDNTKVVSQMQNDLQDKFVIDNEKGENLTKKQLRILKNQNKTHKKNSVKQKKKDLKKTSMSYMTALGLSFRNLMTKKGRTFMTSFAGSIGIIGVSLVLAISNGFSMYINTMQTEVLANYPITIATSGVDQNAIMNAMSGKPMVDGNSSKKFPDTNLIYPFNPMKNVANMLINNNITQEYVDYVKELSNTDYVDSISYTYALDMNIVGRVNKNYVAQGMGSSESFNKYEYYKVNNNSNILSSVMSAGMGGSSTEIKPSINWQEMQGDKDFILSQYDLLAGSYPVDKSQLVLVVSQTNEIEEMTLASMGLDYTKRLDFGQVIGNDTQKGVTFKYANNNLTYKYNETKAHYEAVSQVSEYKDIFELDSQDALELNIVGILRAKEGSTITTLSAGVAYLPQLTQYALNNSMESDIVKAQKNNKDINILTGERYKTEELLTNQDKQNLAKLGGSDIPQVINIYPRDFDSKEAVTAYLDGWNTKSLTKIKYSDMSQLAVEFMSQTIKIISIVLICFASVSLLVSSVMIGIITYVSVVERTKEIGILRSLGARKFDISNVFNAETTIIGFVAGMIGVLSTYLLSIPINLIIYAKIQIGTISSLSPLHALMMVAISMVLTIIAGLVPSTIASKKEPVIALRTD